MLFEIKEEFTNETIQKSFLSHFSYLFSDLFSYAISPYVIVSEEENSLSHILFFASLISTNLIVPFTLNTIYLIYLLFKTIMSPDN